MNDALQYSFRAGATSDSPLAFLVHGRAGNMSVMSTFSRVLPAEWALVFVQAPIADPIGGYSWWDIQDHSGKEHQRNSSFDQLTSFVSQFSEDHGIAPQFIVALGFSQGAAMLSLLAQSHPDMFRALALLSGFILPCSSPSAIEPKPSILVIHGTLDEVIPIGRILEGVELLRQQGFAVMLHQEDVAHKVGIQGMRLLKEWSGKL